MKKLLFIILVNLILIFPLTCTLSLNVDRQNVEAAGLTEETFYLSDNTTCGWLYENTTNDWSVKVNETQADSLTVTVGGQVGWQSQTTANKWAIIEQTIFGFDVSSLPVDAEISSAKVRLWVTSLANNSTVWPTAYFALYRLTTDNVTYVTKGDWDNAYSQGADRTSLIYSWDALNEDEWWEVELDAALTDNWDYLRGDANDLVWLALCSTNHMLNYAPTWENYKYIRAHFDNGDGYPTSPQLVITYNSSTPARTMTIGANAATDNTTDGTETTDNITWGSPRCAYGDEGIYLIVAGDSGAPLDLELVNKDNVVLYSKIDSIRVDGYYHWFIDTIASDDAIVRAVENNSGVSSQWGVIQPEPNDQPSLSMMAVDGDYPQWQRPFSEFVTQKNGLCYIHWKTDIDGAVELGDYSLRLWYLGREASPGAEVFNYTLDNLADNYFKNIPANDVMLHWRYAVFTMDSGSGFEDYDGLVLDASRPYNSSVSGFYEPLIYSDNTSTEITTCHSGYWYLDSSANGVAITLDNSSYPVGSSPVVTVSAGSASKVRDYLNKVRLYIYEDDYTPVWDSGGSIDSKINQYSTFEIDITGDYIMRVQLWSSDTSFTYIYDIPFTVGVGPGGPTGPGTARNLLDLINSSIDEWGLNNAFGHWVILLGVMILLFVVFIRSDAMRVIMPLAAMAVAIVVGWVDVWVIVLLSLGVGLEIWRATRRKVSGGAE